MKRARLTLLLCFLLSACVQSQYAPSPQIPRSPSTQPSEGQKYQLEYHKGLAPSWAQGANTSRYSPQYSFEGVRHLFLRYPESAETFKKHRRKFVASATLTGLAVGLFVTAPLFVFIEGEGVGAVTASMLGASLVLDVTALTVLLRSYRYFEPMTKQYNEGLRRELGLLENPVNTPAIKATSLPAAP